MQLDFRFLKNVPAKLLRSFRRDAGWTERHAPPPAFDARGTVLWLVAELNGKPVAIARLELAAPAFCYVSELIVLEKHRGHGYGHELLERIEAYAAGSGIQRVLLQSVPGAQAFYASQHYQDDPLVPDFLKKELSPFRKGMFLGH